MTYYGIYDEDASINMLLNPQPVEVSSSLKQTFEQISFLLEGGVYKTLSIYRVEYSSEENSWAPIENNLYDHILVDANSFTTGENNEYE